MQNRKVPAKRMLLPLPIEFVRRESLAAHLALSVCRMGQGNRHQFYRLIRTTYLSYLLWQDGYGDASYGQYCDAEGALENAAQNAYSIDEWILLDTAASATGEIVNIFDSQLAAVSQRRYIENTVKLERLLIRRYEDSL